MGKKAPKAALDSACTLESQGNSLPDSVMKLIHKFVRYVYTGAKNEVRHKKGLRL